MVNIQNASFDLLTNASVIRASIKSYEEALTFGGVVWLWPIAFLGTLILIAIKSESPTMVAMFAILGNVALGTLLPQASHMIFWMIAVFSILIWLFSLFLSPKLS